MKVSGPPTYPGRDVGHKEPAESNPYSVLVVIRALNEEGSVGIVVKEVRATLESEDTGPVHWVEKRGAKGSEFYFSGPSKLVRKTHAYIALWVASDG